MKIGKRSVGMAVLLLVAAAGVLYSQEAPTKPIIDPEAATVLHQLSDHNKQVTAGVFRVSDTIDVVQADGRKLQLGLALRVDSASGAASGTVQVRPV